MLNYRCENTSRYMSKDGGKAILLYELLKAPRAAY